MSTSYEPTLRDGVNTPHVWTEREDRRLTQMWVDPWEYGSTDDIGAALNVGRSIAIRRAQQLGLGPRPERGYVKKPERTLSEFMAAFRARGGDRTRRIMARRRLEEKGLCRPSITVVGYGPWFPLRGHVPEVLEAIRAWEAARAA